MESTKVVSLRLALGTYENILLECDAKGITITEWFDRQIALAKRAKAFKYQLLEILEDAFDYDPKYPVVLKSKIRRAIRFTKEEL